jgi:hypothetical protein
MAIIACPLCTLPLTEDEARTGKCPLCGGKLAGLIHLPPPPPKRDEFEREPLAWQSRFTRRGAGVGAVAALVAAGIFFAWLMHKPDAAVVARHETGQTMLMAPATQSSELLATQPAHAAMSSEKDSRADLPSTAIDSPRVHDTIGPGSSSS